MKPRWTGGADLALPRLFDGSDRRIRGVRHLEMATPLLCDPLMLPTAPATETGGRSEGGVKCEHFSANAIEGTTNRRKSYYTAE